MVEAFMITLIFEVGNSEVCFTITSIEIINKRVLEWVDRMYGSRLLIQERLDEKMPQLLFDCRFLQKNSDRNISGFIK